MHTADVLVYAFKVSYPITVLPFCLHLISICIIYISFFLFYSCCPSPFVLRSRQSLKVREHKVFGPYVDGLSQLAVTNFEVSLAPFCHHAAARIETESTLQRRIDVIYDIRQKCLHITSVAKPLIYIWNNLAE